MLEEYWDTEEYQERHVPYYQMRTALLLEYYLFRPKQRKKILQAWYMLGEDIDREYQFRIKNGYNTEDIEKSIALYHECSKILQEEVDHGTEGAVPDTQ